MSSKTTLLLAGAVQFAGARDSLLRGARAVVCALAFVASLLSLSICMAQAAGSGTDVDPFTTLEDAYTVGSGRYYFDLGGGLFQADVDNSRGGGWILVLQYVHQGGTNPALNVLGIGSDLPITSAAALGANESADLTRWGHAGVLAMNQFSGDIELRFYGQTSGHGRVIHFKTTLGDAYLRTGTGSFTGIENNFTPFSDHTANIPGTVSSGFSDQGNQALTNFPFFESAARHWAVRGNGGRWEVDDFPNDASRDTIHRVWVRAPSPIEVINTNDSGAGSLREAINFANSYAAADDIIFNIPGAGPHTITLSSQLPALSDNGITIDGISQPGASCGDLWSGSGHTLQVRVEGQFQGTGITLSADNLTVRGLSITGFSDGIGSYAARSDATIECNYFGVTPGGAASTPFAGSNSRQILLTDHTDVVIDQNVISNGREHGLVLFSNSTNSTITNNFIGTDPTGTSPIGNTFDGIVLWGGTHAISTLSDNILAGGNRNGLLLFSGATVTGSSGNALFQGNHIGVDRSGNSALGNTASGIDVPSGSTFENVTFGGTGAGNGNIVSANGADGFISSGTTQNVDFLGNMFGVGADGTTDLGNTLRGFHSAGVLNSANIGNGTAAGRNVFSGNGQHGMRVDRSNDSSILSNHIGVTDSGNTAQSNGSTGLTVSASFGSSGQTNLLIDGNVISANGNGGIDITSRSGSGAGANSSIVVTNNKIGVGADGTTTLGNIAYGVKNTNVPGEILVQSNTIANNTFDGIVLTTLPGTNMAILSNSIFNNSQQGIDFNNDGDNSEGDGVTPNDAGDADTGPNEMLNHPVINGLQPIGTGGAVLAYDFNLDAPANTDGYRVEFFKNATPDVSGHGEGEQFIGFVDIVPHAGGDQNFTGSFTPTSPVAPGDSISATATRIAAVSFDITSEFSANQTILDPMVVTNTIDTGIGSLRAAIEYANANIDEDNITFNIPDAGPHVIDVLTQLPALTDDGITLDGSTQSGASCGNLWGGTPHTLQVQINDGGSASAGVEISGAGITVRGLSVTGFNGRGIVAGATSSGARIECNYVGLTPAGVASSNNFGIFILGDNAIVGGANSDQGNVVSGNIWGVLTNGGADNVTVQGNFIGTNPAGTSAIGNVQAGLGNNIGTATINTIRRNLISGNQRGFIFQADDTWTGVGGGTFSIAGNYIGTDRSGNVALPNTAEGINFTSGSVSDMVIGGTTTADRNIISGNGSSGIVLSNQTGVDILGNHIGMGANGTTPVPNAGVGILLNDASDFIIGDGTSAGRNIISGNTSRAIQMEGALSNISINGNYVGVDSSGNTGVPSGANDIILGDAVAINGGSTTISNLTFSKNVIASHAGAGFEIVGPSGSDITIQGNSFGVGADGVTDLPGSSVDQTIHIEGTGALSNLQIGGTGIGEGNIVANGSLTGVFINSPLIEAVIEGNTIRDNVIQGVTVPSGKAAILSNVIFDNGTVGIDLAGDNAPTANDPLDGDGGGNEGLNFPVLNILLPAANNTDLNYDLNLDVPADTNGYRIEFFKNLTPDGSGHGEGEIYLGFVDIAHGGGDLNFTGTFTPLQTVTTGDNISATTTRKTATGHDITSEFSANQTVGNALVVTNTNDSGSGSLRAAIDYANANTDQDNISFAIPGAGPHRIDLLSVLPIITDAGVSIDGTTQTGTVCRDLWSGQSHALQIQINGDGSGYVLRSNAENFIARGLSLTNGTNGIELGLVANNATIQCNYLGLTPAGTVSANRDGLRLNANGHLVGGPNGADGNVAAGNTTNNIFVVSGNNTTIQNNLVGAFPGGTSAPATQGRGFTNNFGNDLTIDRNLVSGNGSFGYATGPGAATDRVTFTNNYFGTDRTGTVELANGNDNIHINVSNPGNAEDIVIGTPANGNIISGGSDGILITNALRPVVQDNKIGTDINGTVDIGNRNQGIRLGDGVLEMRIGGDGANDANVIGFSGGDGVGISGGTTTVAILGNTFIDNGELAIDLGNDEVTANDGGDGDTGPNDLLNFPVLNILSPATNNTDVSYDLNLDVPAETTGYRIEFFKNLTPDGNGEGEIYLGGVELVPHAGGDQNFTGTFTPLQQVDVGDTIAATATRITATGFDITSEFSANQTVTNPLVVTKTNDSGLGSLRAAIEYANAFTDQDNITFAIPGAGPHIITVLTQLPALTDNGITLDGATQTGASCGDLWAGSGHNLQIQIEGQFNGNGVTVAADNVTVRGLSITGFTFGIASGTPQTGTTIECNYIGLTTAGIASTQFNFGFERQLFMQNQTDLTINQNVVSNGLQHGVVIIDSSTNTTVTNNFIGTDPTGTVAIGNGLDGLLFWTGTHQINQVSNNLISGNARDGIISFSTAVVTGVGGASASFQGNHIGVDRTGNAALANAANGIRAHGTTVFDNVTIGGTNVGEPNIISGNGGSGFFSEATVQNVDFLGNIIGLDSNGTADLGNGLDAIRLDGVTDNVNIGDGTSGGRNIISGNARRAIQVQGTVADITINGNYIGTDTTGNNAIASGAFVLDAGDAISFDGGAAITTATVSNNVIGGYQAAYIEFFNSSGSNITIEGNNLGVGADGTSNISASALEPLLNLGGTGTLTDVTIGGSGAGQGNLIANSASAGIVIAKAGTTGTIEGNTITGNTLDGITITNGTFAILGNTVSNNGGLGIDIGPDGVSANDSGDADTGPNDLLNFPVFNGIAADGTLSVGYDFNLDVPADNDGYRIEFYRNSSPDSSGHGEGETFLGFVDISHGGGNENFTGTFTADVAVSQGQFITATATSKTATGFDVTSEFAQNSTSGTPSVAVSIAGTTDTADNAVINAYEVVEWTVTVENNGVQSLTNPVLSFANVQDGSNITLTSGPTLASGDGDGDGVLDIGETWIYQATVSVGDTILNNGNDLIASASVTTDQTAVVNATDVALAVVLDFPSSALPRCSGTNLLTNGSFETPIQTLLPRRFVSIPNANVDDWTGGSGSIELFTSGIAEFSQLTFSHSGAQHAELNSNGAQNLVTSVGVNPRAEVAVFWAHRGRGGTDTASLSVADDDGGSTGSGNFVSNSTAWNEYNLTHVSSAAASTVTATFNPISVGNGDDRTGNLIDSVEVCQTYVTLAGGFQSVTDTDGSGTDSAGDTINYQYSVSNPAGNHAPLSIVEIVSDRFGTVSAVPVAGDDGDNVLEPGETWTVEASYALTQSDIDAGTYSSTAYAQADTSNNVIRSDDVDDDGGFAITIAPSITLTKTATFQTDQDGDGRADVGDVITYTYTTTNTGNVTLSAVTLTDSANGNGDPPAPAHVSLTDNGVQGDSTDADADPAVWTTLGPLDAVIFEWNYTVVQDDLDLLQ